MTAYKPLPAGTMRIEDAISYNLRITPLPLSAQDRHGINTLLAWQHAGTEFVHVNQ